MSADTPPMWLREKVVSRRRERGWTQVELANAASVTQPSVSNWELGKTAPNPEEAARLAAALDLDPVTFIGQLWPDVAAADRLSELRGLLADATDEQIADITELVRNAVNDRAGGGTVPSIPKRASR